jgi:broad specificity phosphatase PhoE
VTVRLVLCRHGESDAALRGRCYGRLDPRLSPAGELEAERLAGQLAGLTLAAVYSSTLRRAVATAEPVARVHGLVPVQREQLAEIDFGELEGLTYEEIECRYPEVWSEWAARPLAVRFPGGEGWDALSTRVRRTLDAIAAQHAGDTVAVVAHGGVLRAALAATGADDVFRLELPYACVVHAEWSSARRDGSLSAQGQA